MNQISVKDLLKAGVHFGHQPKRWNPKMKPYIFGERNGVYIIDLQKTLVSFHKAHDFLVKTASEGKTILFVGTKLQAQDVIIEGAEKCGMFYVSQRWLGGMLTNFETIRKSVNKLKKLEELLEKVGLSKKEYLRIDKKRASMNKTLSGIKEMNALPGALVIIDQRREKIAVEEAKKLEIPIVSLVDTNCDPDNIDYVIPGNDDSIRSVSLIVSKLSDAVSAGVAIKKEKDEILAKEKQSANPAKEWVPRKGKNKRFTKQKYSPQDKYSSSKPVHKNKNEDRNAPEGKKAPFKPSGNKTAGPAPSAPKPKVKPKTPSTPSVEKKSGKGSEDAK